MDTSNKIAIVALIISALGIILNWIYTNRKFKSTHFPVIHPKVSIYFCGDNEAGLRLILQNRHSGTSVSDLEYIPELFFTKVLLPCRKLKLSREQVNRLGTNEKVQSDWQFYDTLSNLSPQSFSRKPHTKRPMRQNDGNLTESIYSASYYHASSNFKVRFLVKVSYTPDLENCKRKSRKFVFIISPVISDDKYRDILDWDVRRVK